MENEIITYQPKTATLKEYRSNYQMEIGNYNSLLIRDVDFGVIPNTSKPTLFKSGAEKVLAGYNLTYDIEVVDSYKDYKDGFFYYECRATAFYNGQKVRVGVGCANTNERGLGSQSGFDAANSILKKAKKRAVVDLALSLACLSNCFTQDLDDKDNEKRASALQSDEDFINAKQVKRIFAIAATMGITTETAKSLLLSWGFASTKEIKVKDYDEICDKFKNYKKED